MNKRKLLIVALRFEPKHRCDPGVATVVTVKCQFFSKRCVWVRVSDGQRVLRQGRGGRGGVNRGAVGSPDGATRQRDTRS